MPPIAALPSAQGRISITQVDVVRVAVDAARREVFPIGAHAAHRSPLGNVERVPDVKCAQGVRVVLVIRNDVENPPTEFRCRMIVLIAPNPGPAFCPPEDCGGPWGYQTMLEALLDPGHDRHEDMTRWIGDSFDTEFFDPAKVEFDDPKERWNRAFKKT